MREFVVGDIHGCLHSLRGLLDIIRPEKTDTVVFLGDYVDRGPDSCGVLDTIIELNRTCTVVPISGNHEKMFLQARQNRDAFREWLNQGGRATIDSYTQHGYRGELAGVPQHHWDFLIQGTLDYWETERHIFVHASLDPSLDMDEQSDLLLRWQVFRDPTHHKSGKQIICGHTSQRAGWPAIFGGGICIDTFVYGGGWLTCFETSEQRFIQTNERGKRRSFDLQSFIGP
jgi:serine/threonine protein phosphatase 1